MKALKTKDNIKPVLKWAGGKTSLIPQLVKHFPSAFNRYFEPFFGGGAVFLALKPSGNSVINDVNSEITNFYEIIRDRPKDLMSELDCLGSKYSEDFYYELRASKPRSQVKKAARTLFLNKTCFNGLYRQNSRGEFNVPFGKRPRLPKLYDKNQILGLSKRLKKTELLNLD
ncbi:Dam family site-specific DNA-(adenine-N6)-methyltransferase, partial [bacterium]|nr:Dam family site-specific DNA-(adenine-N6)-methyltransferase [bacterium]